MLLGHQKKIAHAECCTQSSNKHCSQLTYWPLPNIPGGGGGGGPPPGGGGGGGGPPPGGGGEIGRLEY